MDGGCPRILQIRRRRGSPGTRPGEAIPRSNVAEFAHLHVHSQYSFLVSTVQLADLAGKVRERGMRAVAVTDLANMFGTVKHWKNSRAAGIQPIVGAELNVARSVGEHAD